jgi:dihydrofolate reductase
LNSSPSLLGLPRVTLIAGVASNGVIGCDNQLPWRLPEDLKFFKEATQGHTVVMGRKTFESIRRPLPNRRNLVVSRDAHLAFAGVQMCASLEAALALCAADEEVFVIGGAGLYAEAMAHASRLLITHIERSYEGDTLFPEIPADFEVVRSTKGQSTSEPGLEFAWVEYRRPAPAPT